MENRKSSWFIEENELDIGRGIEATLLGVLMMIVHILRTFWTFVGGSNVFEELVFSGVERQNSVTKFARPLTYFLVTCVFYFVTFSSRFQFSETLADTARISSIFLPRTLWMLLVKYLENFAVLCDFIANTVVSGKVWGLAVSMIPIMGGCSLLTVSSILSCKICRASVTPKEHLAITCYTLGTVALIDFVYGIAESLVQGIPHVLLTAFFLVIVWPWVLYRWLALTRCSAKTSRKLLCLILLVNVCVLIAFSIVISIVLHVVV